MSKGHHSHQYIKLPRFYPEKLHS